MGFLLTTAKCKALDPRRPLTTVGYAHTIL